ncbi:MAG: hypothetical protein ACFFAO_17050 [Candidatus Hermodarchaeota archaeon]
MEDFNGKEFNITTLVKCMFKPQYSNLFNKITNLKTPVKNKILMTLLDGNWHEQTEIIRLTRKQHGYMGPVTLQTMVSSLNHISSNNFVRKKMVNGKIYYKISDNFLGLTRAAFTKFRFIDI